MAWRSCHLLHCSPTHGVQRCLRQFGLARPTGRLDTSHCRGVSSRTLVLTQEFSHQRASRLGFYSPLLAVLPVAPSRVCRGWRRPDRPRFEPREICARPGARLGGRAGKMKPRQETWKASRPDTDGRRMARPLASSHPAQRAGAKSQLRLLGLEFSCEIHVTGKLASSRAMSTHEHRRQFAADTLSGRANSNVKKSGH